jgi:hypothetical protein
VIEDIKLSICSDDSETTQTQAAASPLVTSDLPLPSNVEEANRMMVRAHVEYMQTMSTPYPLPSLIEEKKNNWLFYVEQYQLLLQNDSE